MREAPFRTPADMAPRFGRLVDRKQTLRFRFEERRFSGYLGDTLASALLASGVRVFSRSPSFHRPRGLFGLGHGEEAGPIDIATPTDRAAGLSAGEIELVPGLKAWSRIGWPSARIDFGALADLGPVYGPSRLLGLFAHRSGIMSGRPAELPERAVPTLTHTVDLLVVGAGLAGLAAAESAAAEGLSLVLAEAAPTAGGMADLYDGRLEGRQLHEAAADQLAALRQNAAATVLLRTRAVLIEPNLEALLVERDASGAAERLHVVKPRAIVLATGARERGLVFANNDRPGIVAATTARALLRRWGVKPGKDIVVVTISDEGYRAAFDLDDAGAPVKALVDLRLRPEGPVVDMAKARGIPISFGSAAVDVNSRFGRIRGVAIENRFPTKGYEQRRRIDCDTLVVSGGFDAASELATALGAVPELDPATGFFRLSGMPAGMRATGGAAGMMDAEDVVGDGYEAGVWAAQRINGRLRRRGRRAQPAIAVGRDFPAELALPNLGIADRRARAFVDAFADVTVADLAETRDGPEPAGIGAVVATRAMLGGTDPASVRLPPSGRPGGRLAFAEAAAAAPPPAPPRILPLDALHRAAGASTGDDGAPLAFPKPGEALEAAIRREALSARNAVGLADLSTACALSLEGPEAVETAARLLRVPAGRIALGATRLPALDAAGRVRDVVTVIRSDAGRVLVFSMVPLLGGAEGQACLALVGPLAREVFATAFPQQPLPEAGIAELPRETGIVLVAAGELFGLPAVRLLADAETARTLWPELLAAADARGGATVGGGALDRLRLEAGAPAPSQELDGLTTLATLGLAEPAAPDEPRLVGLVAESPDGAPEIGAVLVAAPREPPRRILGRVTSGGFSPARGAWIGLALAENIAPGDTVYAFRRETPLPLRVVEAGEILTAPTPADAARHEVASDAEVPSPDVAKQDPE